MVFTKPVTADTSITGGTVTADKSQAGKGETVTLTVKPDNTNIITEVWYDDGIKHIITADEGVYSFKMPATAVTYGATFNTVE